jgi:hypothetical protein
MFSCTATAELAAKPFLPCFSKRAAGPPLLSGAPPPLPTPVARESQVDSFQSYSQGNQSIVDPPLSVQPIPDSVPADIKLLLQKFPSIICMADVVPNPSHGVRRHHPQEADTPQFLQ